MAAHQFCFVILPTDGINRAFPNGVAFIREYATHDPTIAYDRSIILANYWELSDKSAFEAMIIDYLPRRTSWSSKAVMYGNEQIDNFELWDDFIDVGLDVRELNVELLVAIVETARNENCKFALKEEGRLIDPIIQEVAEWIFASRAARYARDPVGFIKGER